MAAHQAPLSLGFSRQECKSQPQWDITSHLSEWLLPKRQEIASVSEDVKERESLCTVGETVNWCKSESRSLVSDTLRPHALYSPWNSPGQNTGVGSLSLLQGIFPTQRLNPGLLHCRRILYQLSHKGSPLHSKGTYKQNKKTAYRMGENICKWCNWQRLNLQSIQRAHTTWQQQQQKTKQPNKRMGRRPKQTFIQRRNTRANRHIKRCSA